MSTELTYHSPAKKERGLLGKTIRLSSLSLFANLLGFLIPPYIAYFFGVSDQTDDFFFSYGLITFAGTIFSGAVKSVLVPYLVEKKGHAEDFATFTTTLFHYARKKLGIVAVSGILFTGAYYLIFRNNLSWYILLSIPIFYFTVLNALFFGILNALGQFALAETSPFSRAIIIYLALFLLSPYIGITAVILGYNLGETAKFIHLKYVLKRKNNIHFPKQKYERQIIRPFLQKGSIQALSTTISSASPLIDKLTASFLMAGSISLLDYGNKLFAVFNVLLNAFLTILLSKWASDVHANHFTLKKLHQVIGAVSLTSLALLICTGFGKDMVVHFLYPTLASGNQDLISWILLLNMAGFLFSSVNQVINRATIAFRETPVLLKTAVIKSILNILLNIVLAFRYGIIGIAISTILVNIAGVLINYYLFLQQFYKNVRHKTPAL